MSYSSKKFDFTNSEGEKLSGRLELPSNPIAFAIFAHCFTCSKNILAATRISKTLGEMGIAVLRFDFTGLGNSEGDFSNTNFSSNIQDLKSAYAAIEQEFEAPQILIGHSLGGAACLKIAPELDHLKAIVTIGAPSDTEHVTELFQEASDEIEKTGRAKVKLAGREFTIKKQFVDDIKEQDILEGLSKTRKAFLILHSPLDETVSINHAGKIYNALKHPKSYVSLDKADHLVTDQADARYIADLIRTWVSRYIDIPHESRPKISENILVKNRAGHKYTTDIYSAEHHIVADEPRDLKGDDLGMNPYELLLSALGACTAMTVKMYCARKNLDVSKVAVDLSHQKDYFEDCDSCGDERKLLDVITKKITIEGDFTPDEKKRIYEIAEKCPVNKTLQSEIVIKSEHI